MKKLIFILFLFVSFCGFAQNRGQNIIIGKGKLEGIIYNTKSGQTDTLLALYPDSLGQFKVMNVKDPVNDLDAVNLRYFERNATAWDSITNNNIGYAIIWQGGDKIDSFECVSITQMMDSLAALPGGHDAATIGTAGSTAGLSITGQEINMQSATASRNGYLLGIDFANFYDKLTTVAHNNTLTGAGTAADPLKADTAIMAARVWVLNQNYVSIAYIDYDSLLNTPTIPIISDIAYDGTWNGNLQGASKNAIYDKIESLAGGHDALTLSDSASVGGLSITDQLLSFQRANDSQNGFLSSYYFTYFKNKEPALTKGNLTENITGLQFDNTRQVIGGASQLSLSSGYAIPTSAQLTRANNHVTNDLDTIANNEIQNLQQVTDIGNTTTKSITVRGITTRDSIFITDTLPRLKLKDERVTLNPNDVISKIQFHKTDDSSGGTGIPSLIQVRSEDYGGKFAIDFMTGTVADIDTPLILSDTKVLVFNEKAATYPSNKKWAIFGDSFSDAIIGEYGEWVNTKLGLTGTVSFGYPGNRIAHQLDTLNNILTANPDTLDFFNILSLLVGVNDFSANTALGTVDSNAGDANFAGSLKDFIETALTANPLLEIYIMTPTATNTVGLPYGFVNSAGWSLNNLSLLIGHICADYSVNCIDLYALSGFNEQTIATYTTDNLHPNTAGVAAIGKVIANALTNKNSKGRYIKESDPIYLNDTSEIAYINQLNHFMRNQQIGDTNSVSNYISFGSILDRSYVGQLRGGRIGFLSGNGIPSNTVSQRINAATNYAYNSSGIKIGGGSYSFELVNKFNATAGDSLRPIVTVNQSGILNAAGGFNLNGTSINTPGTLTNVVYKGMLTDSLNSRFSELNVSNWNTAYSKKVNSLAFSGTTTKTLTLTLQDGSTISNNFTDLSEGAAVAKTQLQSGIVIDRNIDVTIADYTPVNKDVIKVVVEDDIATGDSITLSINGGTSCPIFEYDTHDKDYILELMYLDGKWFLMTKMGEEASLKGNVDATNLIVNTNGIQYVGLGEDSFTDSTLVPMWWVLQRFAADNNSTQTLVGTTPYWNISNGKNAEITLTGTTTITFSNLTDGDEGTLYVTNGGSTSYRITFAGYNIEIYPSVWYTGDEVSVSGSTKKDVFTYKYIGGTINKVVINGALDLK